MSNQTKLEFRLVPTKGVASVNSLSHIFVRETGQLTIF